MRHLIKFRVACTFLIVSRFYFYIRWIEQFITRGLGWFGRIILCWREKGYWILWGCIFRKCCFILQLLFMYVCHCVLLGHYLVFKEKKFILSYHLPTANYVRRYNKIIPTTLAITSMKKFNVFVFCIFSYRH